MNVEIKKSCFHCGESCADESIHIVDKYFCCTGCKSVYSILNKHELDGYYCLNETPGNTVKNISGAKFQYLDDESIASKIITFKNDKQTQVHFFLPQIHCSSCLWLLENLHKLQDGIISSQVNFNEKKVSISFYQKIISLRQLAELLASIGYEPYITLQDYEQSHNKPKDRSVATKLGVVGFCFANIMLISFPEYLGLEFAADKLLSNFFRYANLLLSLPVLLYGAKEFYENAWASLKQRFLNIDAPIALAITITFIRSVYEIVGHSGAGYLDSMSGIVFFMLIGRSLQHKTFSNLKFNRDFKSYFPISVTQLKDGVEHVLKIQDIVEDDVLKLQHQEIVPVDCILSSSKASIDYSFVTGETDLTELKTGELIYAGGKIQNTSIEVIVVKPFSQNSFTSLWNNTAFKENEKQASTFIEAISKYFSLVLLIIAFSAFGYWQIVNPSNAFNALTAVLIVACPCTLLLASSYTYGFIIELFAKQGMFVKSSNTVQKLADIDAIVFDKTGTLSESHHQNVIVNKTTATEEDLELVLSVLSHSTHPLSKTIIKAFPQFEACEIHHIKEVMGSGIEAWHNDQYIKAGKAEYVGVIEDFTQKGSAIYFCIDNKRSGSFFVSNTLKSGVEVLIHNLNSYKLNLISGDNEFAASQMQDLFPVGSTLKFRQNPQQKLDFIKSLQSKNEKILMIGDGINDAGALKQSEVGISVVENSFSFSPASDAILSGTRVVDLYRFLRASSRVKRLIVGTFIYSLIYNTIGISIAVSAHMKPVVAAILMPASSISVILIAFVGTNWIMRKNFKK